MSKRISIIVTIVLALLLIARAERGYSRLVQQKPLLFGRRGMSPNMNSLFFGKRSDIQSAYDDDELCAVCKIVQPTCNERIKESYLALADDKR
jgi:hypothetical protein